MPTKKYLITVPGDTQNKKYVLTKPKGLFLPFDKTKIKDYLYSVKYDVLDYPTAMKYYRDHGYLAPAGCSVCRNGDYIGRNFDWYYNNEVEFIVSRARGDGNYANIGMCGSLPTMVKSFVENEENDHSQEYRLLPFQMQDGVNECGLFAEYNVVTTDHGENVVIPTEEQEIELSAIVLIRFILDKFDNATSAAEYIKKHCKIYFPQTLHRAHYELHVFLCDAEKSYVLEFVNNRTEIIDVTDKPYMTNFYLYGVEFNADGKVYTPGTQTDSANAYDTNHITENGCGLERYNYIVDHISSVDSVADMESLMRGLFYTKAYTDRTEDIWRTEFVGNGRTVKTPPSGYADVLAVATQYYNERSRDTALTWQTTHSAVYDLTSKTLTLTVQEEPNSIFVGANQHETPEFSKFVLTRVVE